ncbi:MAG: WecB/TagA/CpsF family glycosyltransferase [Xanthobacteraceae bacterium]
MRSVSDYPLKTCKVFGVPVLSFDRNQACDLIEHRIANRTPTRVAFLNANLSLLAIERAEVQQALGDFIVFNDGIGVEIANRVLNGSRFPADLNGTDLMPYLLTRIRRPLRLFLLVGRPQTTDRVVAEFEKRWPWHVVVGHAFCAPNDERSALLSQRVAEAKPDIVIIAKGNPNQELWIAENVPQCAPCAFGVGGLFDFMIGEAKRAPVWVRVIRMEWMFRLAREPRRLWRRYLIGGMKYGFYIAFGWLTLRSSWFSGWGRMTGALAANAFGPVSSSSVAGVADGQVMMNHSPPLAPDLEPSCPRIPASPAARKPPAGC